jgi:predicted RNA-binding Zn-ribbon protein involved in translation (DUF1610 family)
MQTPPPQATAPERIHRYPCPVCGADLLYEPTDGFLSCPYCRHKEPIPTSADEVQERSFEQYLQIRPEQMKRLAANALEVQCQSCGALITFTPPEVARECDFCGAHIVAQAKSADPILAPEGVLPFCVTQQQANTGLREWLSSRWFAPNALKSFAQPDAISGTYLPFWTYDTNTTSYYNGERGEHYYVTEAYYERDSQGNQIARTRQVQYVSRDIGGDEQRIHNVSTHYSRITFKHLLLPVYTGAYSFNRRVFQIVVNGRTGEIQGDRPYSFWKIALFVMALLFVFLVIALVFGSH